MNDCQFNYVLLGLFTGAFLIPFVFFLIACGFPLYFMEVAVGQFTGKGCFHVWEACPLFKGNCFGRTLLKLIASSMSFQYNDIQVELMSAGFLA